MVDILFELGFTEKDFKLIKEFIDNSNTNDLERNIYLLEQVGCDSNGIRNIIIGNPFFLNRSFSDIKKLIDCLYEYGFQYLNLLFESYPNILNKDAFEIRYYINNKISNGEELEDIVDEIDSNPIIIEEI